MTAKQFSLLVQQLRDCDGQALIRAIDLCDGHGVFDPKASSKPDFQRTSSAT